MPDKVLLPKTPTTILASNVTTGPVIKFIRTMTKKVNVSENTTMCVITSYSIHYTKLYDFLFLFPAEPDMKLSSVCIHPKELSEFPLPDLWLVENQLVITSYSIHYTKLYEVSIGLQRITLFFVNPIGLNTSLRKINGAA